MCLRCIKKWVKSTTEFNLGTHASLLLATEDGRKSAFQPRKFDWNADFLLSSVASSRPVWVCNFRFWKLKVNSNKSVDLRNISLKYMYIGLPSRCIIRCVQMVYLGWPLQVRSPLLNQTFQNKLYGWCWITICVDKLKRGEIVCVLILQHLVIL